MKVYRPCGADWYHRGFYYHPIESEALGNLSKGASEHGELVPQEDSPFLWKLRGDNSYFSQDNTRFRWLPLDQVQTVDYIVCSTDRTQHCFQRLRNDLGLKAKIIRYVGNREENVDESTFDIMIPATLRYYNEFKDRKPCVLYHPEFDTDLYSFTPVPSGSPIVRNFLNFTYHHRESGSPWEIWNRYVGYCDLIGASSVLHGLGTPPPGVEVELDVIIDTCFDKMGLPHLKDRSKWPDLMTNRGEPSSHKQIAELMKFSNMAVHIKRGSEGYGFVIHCLAACGRPFVIEPQYYDHLASWRFMQNRETCIHVNGHDPIDKENFLWALDYDNNQRMSKTLYQRFRENVDFDEDARKIKNLL